MAHEVRLLKVERDDEGGESIGELRRATCRRCLRLPEARRVPGDDGVVASEMGTIHCQVRLSAGAPWTMTSGGPDPARV